MDQKRQSNKQLSLEIGYQKSGKLISRKIKRNSINKLPQQQISKKFFKSDFLPNNPDCEILQIKLPNIYKNKPNSNLIKQSKEKFQLSPYKKKSIAKAECKLSDSTLIIKEITFLYNLYLSLSHNLSEEVIRKIKKPTKEFRNNKAKIQQHIENLYTKYNINKINDHKLKFGKDITITNLFICSVKIIEKKIKSEEFDMEELEAYKRITEFNIENLLASILKLVKTNSILIQLKRDMFLSFLCSPIYIKFKQLSKIFNLSSYEPCSTSIFINQKLNKTKFLNSVLTSKSAVASFLECLRSQKTDIDFNPASLKIKIESLLLELKIYRVKLPKTLHGITIQNQSIFISSRLFDIESVFIERRDAAVLIVLVHEFSHFLVRKLIPEKMTFLNITDPFFYHEKEFDEIGNFVEFLLIDSRRKYYSTNSFFLLNIKNWERDISNFKNSYMELYNSNVKEKRVAFVLSAKSEMTMTAYISEGYCGRDLFRKVRED